MSMIDSSTAPHGVDRKTTAEPAAAATLATRSLLAAAAIWSTDTAAVVQPDASAPAPVAAEPADKTENPEPAAPAVAAENPEPAAPARALRPSEVMARFKSFSSSDKRAAAAAPAVPPAASQPRAWPPPKLSLALQGGGSFAAFTWGVLDRLLEEPGIAFDTISGASAGAVNALLLASGFATGGREHARALLTHFWNRVVSEATFRSLMLIGGFSPASSAVAFGSSLRSRQLDPVDLDPLRHALAMDIDFQALRSLACPRLLIAATRVRDGRPQIFRNIEITPDAVLASICPPLAHCAVEIDGETFWDGSFGANPPLLRLVQEQAAADVLVVQVTPSRDTFVPVTGAAIDRRLDQITANAALNT